MQFEVRTVLSLDQLRDLLSLCLANTYFSYGGKFHQQCHGCSMGSPVSTIISNLYMEKFEHIDLSTFVGLQHPNGFGMLIIKQNEVDCFFDHINQVDPHIKLTQEGLKENKLAVLDCLVFVCLFNWSSVRKTLGSWWTRLKQRSHSYCVCLSQGYSHRTISTVRL